jgi:hypothetical protein
MGKEIRVIELRRVCCKDEMNREYVFLSNNMTISAEEIALICRKRWVLNYCSRR